MDDVIRMVNRTTRYFDCVDLSELAQCTKEDIVKLRVAVLANTGLQKVTFHIAHRFRYARLLLQEMAKAGSTKVFLAVLVIIPIFEELWRREDYFTCSIDRWERSSLTISLYCPDRPEIQYMLLEQALNVFEHTASMLEFTLCDSKLTQQDAYAVRDMCGAKLTMERLNIFECSVKPTGQKVISTALIRNAMARSRSDDLTNIVLNFGTKYMKWQTELQTALEEVRKQRSMLSFMMSTHARLRGEESCISKLNTELFRLVYSEL
jgi:hypothetical protein